MPAGVPTSPGGIEAADLTAFDHTDGLPLPIPRTTASMPASRNDLAAVKMGGPNSPYKATVAIFLAVVGGTTWSVKGFISVVNGSLSVLLEEILTCRKGAAVDVSAGLCWKECGKILKRPFLAKRPLRLSAKGHRSSGVRAPAAVVWMGFMGWLGIMRLAATLMSRLGIIGMLRLIFGGRLLAL